MDEQRRFDEDRDPGSEGVRIIGAEEAAEAMERGDVAPRRRANEPRFGDRPPTPDLEGPRPVLRFPLGASEDPRDIERGPVEPAEPSGPVELPHWTEPPTGQVPRLGAEDEGAGSEDWAAYASGASPRWRDEVGADEEDDFAVWEQLGEDAAPVGALDDRDRPSDEEFLSFADLDQPQAGRSVFADEPGYGWEEPYEEAAPTATVPRPRRGDPFGGEGGGPPAERDMGQAVVVGVGFLAAALILFSIGPTAGMVLVTAVIGLAAAELFAALRRVGYQPVALAGITASVGMVIGAYNYGPSAIPTVLFLTAVVGLLWYLPGVGVGGEAPTMNLGVTLLGVIWVGMFGAFAALMLGIGDPGIGLLLAAILGTVGYDVGGLFIGRNAGRQPLSAASPNKTVEGLLGGCVVAFVVVTVLAALVGFGLVDSFAEGALVGLIVAVAAPLGDLSESLVKRDLGLKDMGTVLPGHGGLLDRFDSLLFVLPSVWLLATVRDFFV